MPLSGTTELLLDGSQRPPLPCAAVIARASLMFNASGRNPHYWGRPGRCVGCLQRVVPAVRSVPYGSSSLHLFGGKLIPLQVLTGDTHVLVPPHLYNSIGINLSET